MNLSLTESQRLIEESAIRLLSRLDTAASRDEDVTASASRAWRDFANTGWLGMPLAEAHGGFDGGVLESGLLMRAFGRYPATAPTGALYFSSVLLATRLIADTGTELQRQLWLPALTAGDRRAAMAHDESGNSSPWAPRRTLAQRDANGWRLHGEKAMVMGAPAADVLVVSASLQEAGANDAGVEAGKFPLRQGLFLVALGATDGVRSVPTRAADGTPAADLWLDGVWMPDTAMLGAGLTPEVPACAASALSRVISEGLIALSWEASGAMRSALEMTVQYTAQREQFGRALASFQVVQHRLAEMSVACEEAIAACELAALRVQHDPQFSETAASMAKSKVGRAARYVAEQAVQLHGAMGVSEELPVSALFRKLTQYQQQGGPTGFHSARLGTRLLSGGDWRLSQTLISPTASPYTPSHHAA
ncbi:acyl-CoA dehydrogenase family protein [Cupriavidus campinensis]